MALLDLTIFVLRSFQTFVCYYIYIEYVHKAYDEYTTKYITEKQQHDS